MRIGQSEIRRNSVFLAHRTSLFQRKSSRKRLTAFRNASGHSSCGTCPQFGMTSSRAFGSSLASLTLSAVGTIRSSSPVIDLHRNRVELQRSAALQLGGHVTEHEGLVQRAGAVEIRPRRLAAAAGLQPVLLVAANAPRASSAALTRRSSCTAPRTVFRTNREWTRPNAPAAAPARPPVPCGRAGLSACRPPFGITSAKAQALPGLVSFARTNRSTLCRRDRSRWFVRWIR